jgi:hypothetical protein
MAIEEFLPRIDKALDNSDEVRITFFELYKKSKIYGYILMDFLRHQKEGRIGEQIVIDEQISLQTDNGKAYSQVKKLIQLLRKQLKEKL